MVRWMDGWMVWYGMDVITLCCCHVDVSMSSCHDVFQAAKLPSHRLYWKLLAFCLSPSFPTPLITCCHIFCLTYTTLYHDACTRMTSSQTDPSIPLSLAAHAIIERRALQYTKTILTHISIQLSHAQIISSTGYHSF